MLGPAQGTVLRLGKQRTGEQQARPGMCKMTLVQFDSQAPFEVLVEALDVRQIAPLDTTRYAPRGGTPLLDALGELLDCAERRARGRDEDCVVVVFTDGEENASCRWTRSALFERIAALKAAGWAFVFLGANQDSYAEAGSLGFAPGSTSNWRARSSREAFDQLNRSLRSYREKGRAGRTEQSTDFFEGRREAEEDAPADSTGTHRRRTQ